MYDKTKYIYVGLDLHKEQHTAVIIDCFNEKLGEITFQNKPSEFSKLLVKAKRYCTDGKGIVFALENSYGYGRALAAWLLERDYIVKDVNPALSYAYRKSVPQYKKNDSYDAQCVARVVIHELNNLPDAMPEDMCWTLSQLVNRRANLKTHHIRLKNQLQEQVCVAYPSYKQFFQDIGRPTALYFWEHYPSPRLLRGYGRTGRGINPGQPQSVFYTEVSEDFGCGKGIRRHYKGLSAGTGRNHKRIS